MRVSGRFIRHQHIRDSKDLKYEKKISVQNVKRYIDYFQFEIHQKNILIDIISYLTIALRSRYSGLEDDKDKRYFNTNPENSKYNFGISTYRLETYINENLFNNRGKTEHINFAIDLLRICTHRHTTWSYVCSYTRSAEEIIEYLNQNPDNNICLLKDIRDYLENQLKNQYKLSSFQTLMMQFISILISFVADQKI